MGKKIGRFLSSCFEKVDEVPRVSIVTFLSDKDFCVTSIWKIFEFSLLAQ